MGKDILLICASYTSVVAKSNIATVLQYSTVVVICKEQHCHGAAMLMSLSSFPFSILLILSSRFRDPLDKRPWAHANLSQW